MTGGAEEVLGPARFGAATDAGGESNLPWCWCDYSVRRDGEQGKPHYTHDRWEVGPSRRVGAARVWTDGCLSGLQLVAMDGAEGPRWGFCEGEPAGEIRFGADGDGGRHGGSGAAAGLKLFFGDNGRKVTYNDSVVVCLQALEM